ncbi:hypothetical protein Trydic_g19253 [Trypoxylus dichotomus]
MDTVLNKGHVIEFKACERMHGQYVGSYPACLYGDGFFKARTVPLEIVVAGGVRRGERRGRESRLGTEEEAKGINAPQEESVSVAHTDKGWVHRFRGGRLRGLSPAEEEYRQRLFSTVAIERSRASRVRGLTVILRLKKNLSKVLNGKGKAGLSPLHRQDDNTP